MLLLLGATGWSGRRVTIVIAGVVTGIAIVAGAGLLTRLAPEVLTAPPAADPRRLAWPITYWNGLGLLAAVGMLLALHLASWPGSSRILRPLAAALLPPLAVTLYLTLSRGAILAGAIGLVAYLVLGRPRALICALLAAAGPTVFAVLAAYRAPSLLGFDPSLPATVADGREVGEDVIAAMAVAMVLRALLLPVDGWLARLRLPRLSLPARLGVAASVVAVLIAAMFATGAAAWGQTQARTLLRGTAVRGDDVRTRLLTVDNDGRFGIWRVAVDAFERRPLAGQRRGHLRDRLEARARIGRPGHRRPLALPRDTWRARSRGDRAPRCLPVGAPRRAAWRARGPDRPLYAAVLAALMIWAVHAALDWDWELMSVSIWVFGLAGAALAARRDSGPLASPLGRLARVVLALGCLVLLLLPIAVSRSQADVSAAARAFVAGDCARTTDAALDSIDAFAARADPWELLAYCNVRAGEAVISPSWPARRPCASTRTAGIATTRSPSPRRPPDWTRGPRQRARWRSTRSTRWHKHAVKAFSSGGRRTWARRALRLPAAGLLGRRDAGERVRRRPASSVRCRPSRARPSAPSRGARGRA